VIVSTAFFCPIFTDMRSILVPTLFLVMSTGWSSCSGPGVQENADEFRGLRVDALINFSQLPTEATSVDNPLTEEKVLLGQTLFYDNRLSKNGTQSCNTCHNLSNYGVDNEKLSLGDDGVSLTARNTPTVLNAALYFRQFWDGRTSNVEKQAGKPILNANEMGIPNEQFLVDRLSSVEGYWPMFEKAFPNDEEPLTFENIRKALAAFERKLITPSAFDLYQAGDDSALTDAEKRGLSAFIGLRCVNCHTTNTFGGSMFERRGFYNNFKAISGSPSKDLGRFEVTGVIEDTLLFKVPTLRNIVHTGPYFHDGYITELREAVRIMGKAQLDEDLSERQIDQLMIFLNALTGEVPKVYQAAPPMPQ
jgi:cytochrome c peroxidase